MNSHYSLLEICRLTGLDEKSLTHYIECEWITPLTQSEMDAEDLARIKLILELQNDFGANEAAIPVILHLIDQLYYFRRKLQQSI